MSESGLIFISYRRSDSIAETERIYDRLVIEFGREQVFKDVDSIPSGVNFAECLDQALSGCQVVLVVIGKTWATVTEADGVLRLNNPDDFVRIEIESALKLGIPVIPVLLEGANMPNRVELPESLHPLCRRQGMLIGYDPRFHTDVNRLVKRLREALNFHQEKRMFQLRPETLKKIVILLGPYLNTEHERRTRVTLSVGKLLLLDSLPWSNSNEVFIVELVSRLVDYGQMESGDEALWVFLDSIKSYGGVDFRKRIDKLWTEIYS